MDDLKGHHPDAYSLVRNRISILPSEYTERHAAMIDVSRLYPSSRPKVSDEDRVHEDSWRTGSVVKKRSSLVKQTLSR